ncbi:F-actin-monooxygenase Mical-like isoform X2 [Penaeus chinensis]|uniref:F-actin-monooxygenase Mical-like isoform X2 n=1 Tax=Penaeus chinensis TaxID=139456 RepID=UPI001FB72C2F|nr:F-actin-monooxygenase Mical-like isoform X2 [Penaeus chinensis]
MYNSGHHHHHHKQGAPVSPDSAAAADVFEQLCTASTFKSVLYHYRLLCDVLRLKPTNFRNFYPKLKSKLRSWKAQAIWSKFDKRSSHKCYNHGKACTNSKVLIIGAGPCGLRTAIEAQLLGAKVVVVEKRDRFSRNNVLHLWPFVINDLKQLGAKKFYGKFCAGAIDHISIRQLQCILLKVALLLGVEIYENVSFEELTEPPEDQNEKIGWRARLSPPDHPANQYEFDVLIGADGKRNTLHGFKRKEFRGKLAIAITANFINKRTELEARVQEISGVAFIFNQKFFKELYAATGIDLENIVYYKDETHYFVMTAKKQSLIEKGVILRDLQDTQQLLHPSNVDRNALMEYAREAADFSTSYQLPHLDFAVNHYGKPDVAMFDFTSMFAAENACRMVEKRGHKLLSGLVGDSLLEPFWPTGSGCARGFLSSFDACWMIRSFSSGKMMPLEVLAERESIYRLLAQTTPENLSKDHSSYSLDPASRYPTINLRAVLPFQVRSLFNTDDPVHLEEITNPHLVNNDELPKKRKRRDSFIHPDTLLIWCKKQVALYDTVSIENMTTSFKDGRALCAIIHRYRPDLIDFEALRPEDIAQNNQLAYDILERDFGIPPVMTGREMAECEIPDKLSMISYVSQIYDVFRGEIPHIKHPKMDDGEMEIEQSHIQHSTRHVNILKNLTNKTANVSQGTPTSKKRSTLERGTPKRDDGRITCRLVEDAGGQGGKSDTLKKTKKRRSDRVVSPQERQGREEPQRKPLVDHKEEFSDKVRDLEAKFTANSSSHASDKKPKDLIRAIGKIEKSDWNMVAIEKKMHEDKFGMELQKERERVPKWNRDAYDDKADKFQNIERRLRENGEDEETIAKYRDIDASLKRLEMKLREGSTLETGLRGQNKVSNLASQLSSKWERKETEKIPITRQPSRPMVPLPTSGSDLCHFCGNRVYLVERLSAEGKFFHRQCFKCDYCAANLRLGNYIYDREGTYGGKFFCIPHFGLTSRARGVRRKVEDTDSAKENIVPPAASSTPQPKVQVPVIGGGGGATAALLTVTGGAKVGTPTTISPEDRGTTPERVEFENSVVEQSDEEEYLSEDEWTDRNFGASANELDDTDGDEDSDYSDLSDEEAEDEEMEFIEGGGTLTAAETRRLAESWQRRYSTDRLDDDDGVSGHETESDLESDNYSEEYGAEGDESHTATEGEGGDDDDEDDDGEAVKRARELRRMEVNIDVTAPPRKAETSDSGSDTEVASDEESEESDTQIDTDSEFAEDHVQPGPPKEIPTIVIDESQDTHHLSHSPEPQNKKSPARPTPDKKGEPRSDLVAQKVDLGKIESQAKNSNDKDWSPEGGEKSASLTNLNNAGKIDLHAEQLKRLLQRTESTEAIAAKRALQLKRQYLLGESANLPRKSVSTADLGNRFKSFMEKISETQKMLNPAPQPSAAMQAFMSTSVPATRSPISSPSSPHLPARSISLPQGDASSDSTNADKNSTETVSTTSKDVTLDITTRVESSVYPVEASNNEKIEDGDDKLKSFPLTLGSESDKSKGAVSAPEKSFSAVPVQVSSSESSSSSSSESESDYDNVPSGHKKSFVHKIPSTIDMREEKLLAAKNDNVRTSDGNSDDAKAKPAVSKEGADAQPQPSCDKKIADDCMEVCASDGDDFGLSKPGQSESEGIETINQELVRVNAPRSLDQMQVECASLVKEEAQPVVKQSDLVESQKVDESQKSIDELFDQLANDAVEDIERFSELVESPEVKVSGVLHKEQAHVEDNAVKYSDRKVSESTSSEQSLLAKVVAEKSAEPTDIGKTREHSQEEVKSEPMVVEPCVEIVIEECKKTKDIEMVEEKLSPRSLLDADVSESKCSLKSSIEDDEGSESKRSHKSTLDEDISESKRSLKKDVLSSPEGKELTEAELSDWAGDNDGFSAGEDLEIEVNQTSRLSVKKGTSKTIARIASEESLGDTDSAISTGPSKTASVPSKPSVLADLEGIEYMDTGGESASSPEEVSHIKEGYTKLGAETPTTPVAPQISMVGTENLSGCDSKSSDSTSTELEDSSQSSVQEALNNNIIKDDSVPLLENSPEEAKDIPEEPRSISEPPSLSESKPKLSSEQRRDSLDDYVTKSRYEGYIPRFKERVSPFGYVRDSLDVRRNSTKSPLFTPTKQDIVEREKNENRNEKLTVPTTENVSLVSPNTAKKQIEKSLKGKDKEKEKDLIREMVMSRISRKTPDKNTRRGSRTSISPLSSTSSRTSLFSPQSSQENLLEKVDTPVNGSTDNITNGEVPEKKTIHADCKKLLRLDTITSDLPESGDTFDAEEKRMKVRVGAAFRQDSVLGSGAKRSISEVSGDLPESGQTFQAEENRSKVRVGAMFREDSVLGTVGKHGSLQDVNVPFADDSQDEEVFVLKEDERNIVVSSKKVPKSPRKEKSPRKSSPIKEVPSPSHNNLPATPLTHPEQFDQPCPKRELFKVPTTIAPTPPPRTQHAASLKGMYTPIGVERPISTPNLSTVEREKVREEARLRAKLKTDLDLGLSPPNLADNLREKLKKGSVSESECDREDHVKDSLLRTNTTSKGDEVRAKDKEQHVRKDAPVKGEESRTKDKEERVRELLAEQREHRQREPEGKKEEWCNKDDRVRERLEEYRQKRRGSTKSSENGDSRPNSQLLRRTTHRPSLLELESLQVFTSSPSKGSAPTTTLSTTNTTPSISSSSSTITNAPSDQKSISITSAPAAVMSTTAPSSKQVEDTPASEKTQEKKSGKKSKDRERRRSLIQVFTGMFSKSGDEKKKNEQQQHGSDVQDSGSKAAAQQTNVAPAETPKCAPKSPSSMRDKLSKLRLSRSKEKKAVEKGRSTSADILDDRGSSDDTRSAFSLPTSPSRRPLSSLTSPFTKASSPPQASGSAYSSSPQVRLATPRIEEESLSDDDGGSPAGTPSGTLDRSGQVPGSNSASRRQRNAALRAARQAELKRLRMAQEIQRQLEECEVKTRELEERGVAVEKALRGEGGGVNRDEAELMGDWFSMVHEKNALVRWEQELMVRAKELELEDRHVRLEHELRRRMALSEHEKSREDIDREGTILAEILNILEQKDALVNMLEEDRQRCDHSHHQHHHSNKNPSPSTSDTNEKLPQIHITNLPCNPIECSPTTAVSPPHLTTIPQSFKDSHTAIASFSKLSSLLPANNKGLLTSLLNPDSSQCSSLTSVLHGSLTPSSGSSQSSANVSVASSRRSSQFDQFPQNSKPSVFDIDPCSRMCTHAQHARRKVNLFSRLSRVRRTTLPDLSPGDGEPFSDPPLHYRRYSLSIQVPYRMPTTNRGTWKRTET